MPSRLEGFGIVFPEALARGLPCIGRDSHAMPESITPGVSGGLITGDDEHELAGIIAAALADDALYEACRERATGRRVLFMGTCGAGSNPTNHADAAVGAMKP